MAPGGTNGPARPLRYKIPAAIKQKSLEVDIMAKVSAITKPKEFEPAQLDAQPQPAVVSDPLRPLQQRRAQPRFVSMPVAGGSSLHALAGAAAAHKLAGSVEKDERKVGEHQGCPSSIKASRKVMPILADFDIALDLDENCRAMCQRCCLPLGDLVYRLDDGKGAMVHCECLAQQMLQDVKDEDEHRVFKDNEDKRKQRMQYEIGWKVEQIPRNLGLQEKLKGMIVSHGMCCLVLSEDSKTVSLAPTLEPAAAVSLEYLSLALQIRKKEGREPWFSLDPAEGDLSGKNASQLKKFEPEWLAGTSVGEVLFQSDYHLKELSMGVCDQPVVGMKSCFEFSQEGGMIKESWNAREWFMVRKAEIHVSEDNVLIPHVKMGVEAREQVLGADGLQDAPITRKDHPMVKYAESFTKNFDLIAERRSVVYHLRELAKACVMAKFLFDAEIQVEESWFNLAGQTQEACTLEIPQLWNERAHSNIHMRDGALVGSGKTRMHGVYGGVRFGLEKFDISGAVPRKRLVVAAATGETQVEIRAAAKAGALPVPTPKAAAAKPKAVEALAPKVLSTSGLSGLISPVEPGATKIVNAVPLSASLPPSRAGVPRLVSEPFPVMTAPAIGTIGAPMATSVLGGQFGLGPAPAGSIGTYRSLRGVDLNLNQFSLETVEEVVEGAWTCEAQPAVACKANLDAFWDSVENRKESADEGTWLKGVFNPHLSDRRTESERFTPPDTSVDYTNKLRSLLKEEDEARQQRIAHFLSASFDADKPGSLFPLSWTESLEISHAKVARKGGEMLMARDNYSEEAQQVMLSGAPAFVKTAEDGTTFRIYRVGSLEVRTTQEHDGKETVGVIFSVREATSSISGCSQLGQERIMKVTEYVEKAPNSTADFQYYVVLETEGGSTVVTEQNAHEVSWQENMKDLEDRNSLAKVIRTTACHEGVRVQELSRAKRPLDRLVGGNVHKSKPYAMSVYTFAVGGVERLLQSMESSEQRCSTQNNIDRDDDMLEQNVAESVAVGEQALKVKNRSEAIMAR